MVALVVGLALIAFSLLAVLPFGLDWWSDVLRFLRGALPVMAAFIGLLAVFIGLADLKDRAEAKKEEEAEKKAESSSGEGLPKA
jgi:TRAP-type C4-dicarboxylate transport system permease small subunit